MDLDTLLYGTHESIRRHIHVPKYYKLDFDKIQKLATTDEKLDIILQLFDIFNFSIEEFNLTQEMSKYTKII